MVHDQGLGGPESSADSGIQSWTHGRCVCQRTQRLTALDDRWKVHIAAQAHGHVLLTSGVSTSAQNCRARLGEALVELLPVIWHLPYSALKSLKYLWKCSSSFRGKLAA
eukprot:gnl/TRDRNA2_/TRDRNA2_155220_c0_seq2.p1 gnl/TRDRNA2_/TRDRNA2_155220_c0~~gnl/TRDRNA2_/TRDRNA2_155220_c0_seq2.p1  ORF type:complete len:109 (-),score=5.27 gnl/TRDRNA2_/TRDRNA2_155220_c0_seq2:749-1075(-)